MQLYGRIKQLASEKELNIISSVACDCVELMANHAVAVHAVANHHKSWEEIGFKYLSFQGYDTTTSGLRVIDYGNYEYLHMMEFFCLWKPCLETHLNTLRQYWPSLNIWHKDKSEHDVERIADVFECIMAAFRGDEIFKPVMLKKVALTVPEMFGVLVSLCKLHHTLSAHLGTTGIVKYSQKSVCILSKFVDCDFATVWRNKKQTGHGILMYGLLRAMADESV